MEKQNPKQPAKSETEAGSTPKKIPSVKKKISKPKDNLQRREKWFEKRSKS